MLRKEHNAYEKRIYHHGRSRVVDDNSLRFGKTGWEEDEEDYYHSSNILHQHRAYLVPLREEVYSKEAIWCKLVTDTKQLLLE